VQHGEHGPASAMALDVRRRKENVRVFGQAEEGKLLKACHAQLLTLIDVVAISLSVAMVLADGCRKNHMRWSVSRPCGGRNLHEIQGER